ncbi:hypothetical protein BJ875DRAFT_144602 [Amylocarpus encephaloides]|uniref:Inner kinetochore subunit AME1 domain-containing protein n=1 Tax=Amylocarpus encephaloides TaxID=45428 RepID=A0A9P7YBM0_9HELO|nr:hypothetical protein BJ875DRAFT_144602 [Amylocarpus encephaloides]
MDLTREERMQQRLRGSQRRQVKDVDFGLAFPVPPLAVSAEAASPPLPLPQDEDPPSTRRNTPTTRSQAQLIQGPEPSSLRPIMTKVGLIDANTSAKRRKLDSDTPSSTRITRSSQKEPSIPDVYTLVPEEPAGPIEPVAEVPQDFTIVRTPSPSVRGTQPDLGNEPSTLINITQEEVTESPRDAPGSGHRAQIISTLTTSSKLQGMQDDTPLKGNSGTPISRRKRKRGEVAASPTPIAVDEETRQLSPTSDSRGYVDELSSNRSIERSEEPAVATRSRRSILVHDQESNDSSDHDPEEAEEIDDIQAAIALKKIRGQRISRHAATSPDLDKPMSVDLNPSVPRRGKRKTVTGSVDEPHTKTKNKGDRRGKKKLAKKAKSRSATVIPVVAYRLSKRLQYDEENPIARILNEDVPNAERPGVNAIDVLSGMCHEILDSSLATLLEGEENAEDPLSRREYTVKRRAFISFKEELKSRLLSHTTNLDYGYSLGKGVRAEQKNKLDLRGEILRVRAEREQVALRIDEVRINHENETTKSQEHDALNIAAHDIELAVERGRAGKSATEAPSRSEIRGVEILLKQIISKVSKKGDSGGILKQIKDCNGFLERAALALESKRP